MMSVIFMDTRPLPAGDYYRAALFSCAAKSSWLYWMRDGGGEVQTRRPPPFHKADIALGTGLGLRAGPSLIFFHDIFYYPNAYFLQRQKYILAPQEKVERFAIDYVDRSLKRVASEQVGSLKFDVDVIGEIERPSLGLPCCATEPSTAAWVTPRRRSLGSCAFRICSGSLGE
jgi:hypothetical protein